MEETFLNQFAIKSYEEYEDLISSLNCDNYIFRGHENQEWGIVPSFRRKIREKLEKNLSMPNEEKRIFEFLKTEFAKKYALDKNNVWDILSVMQHFGIETRLLDFSLSPYVGAFFAVTENSFVKEYKEFRSTIFIINNEIITESPLIISMDELSEFSKKKDYNDSFPLYKYISPINIERIRNQESIFVFWHDPEEEIENRISIENNWQWIHTLSQRNNLNSELSRTSCINRIDCNLDLKSFSDFREKLAYKKGIDWNYIYPDEIGKLQSIKNL